MRLCGITESFRKRRLYLVRSESALKEAADSDRCIIIEGTVQACSRTENGTRYTADGLVICKVGQRTWQAGGENEAETAQRMFQTVDKTSSADNTLPKSHVISFTLTQEKAAPEIGDRRAIVWRSAAV